MKKFQGYQPAQEHPKDEPPKGEYFQEKGEPVKPKDGDTWQAILHVIAAETAKVNLLNAIHDELMEVNEKTPTLRDQFAIAVLQGVLSGRPDLQLGVAARHCYTVADAMLAAREVGNE